MSKLMQDYDGFADRPFYEAWDLDNLYPLHSIHASNRKERDRFFKYIKDQYGDRRVQIQRVDKTGITVIDLKDIGGDPDV